MCSQWLCVEIHDKGIRTQEYTQGLPVLIIVYPLINYSQNDKLTVQNDKTPFSSWFPFIECSRIIECQANAVTLSLSIISSNPHQNLRKEAELVQVTNKETEVCSWLLPSHHILSTMVYLLSHLFAHPQFSLPLWNGQKLLSTFSGGSLHEWQCSQCRNPNPGFRAPPWVATPSPAAHQAGWLPSPSGAWSFAEGANSWFITQLPFHFSHTFATLEANPQSPGQKNLKATSLGVFCVGWFIFFYCFYFNLPIGVFPFFYNGHFLLSKFRNIFPPASPTRGVASSG